jgi:MarR-like DNA-binding transcriptional regulator SgrR of sgrS sRNA
MLEFITRDLPRKERIVYERLFRQSDKKPSDFLLDDVANITGFSRRSTSYCLKNLERKDLIVSYDSAGEGRKYQAKVSFKTRKGENVSINARDFMKYLACVEVAMKEDYFNKDSVGITRSQLAKRFNFSNEELDEALHTMNVFLLEATLYSLEPLREPL